MYKWRERSLEVEELRYALPLARPVRGQGEKGYPSEGKVASRNPGTRYRLVPRSDQPGTVG